MKKVQRVAVSGSVKQSLPILLSLFAAAGCSLPVEKSNPIAFGVSPDQQDLVGYYRDEAMILREKAAMIAESAVRYERLFGPQSDWVTGAQQLSQYYAIAAQDLERRAEAYDRAARTKRQQDR